MSNLSELDCKMCSCVLFQILVKLPLYDQKLLSAFQDFEGKPIESLPFLERLEYFNVTMVCYFNSYVRFIFEQQDTSKISLVSRQSTVD